MNYWLHRISYMKEVSWPLLEQGYLSTGFDYCATEDFLKINDWDVFKKWVAAGRSTRSLWRYLKDFKLGDRVLVPGPGDFSLFEIVGSQCLLPQQLELAGVQSWDKKPIELKDDKLHVAGKPINLGFFWQVKPIARWISRASYADRALGSRMKIRGTNAHISDLASNIETALQFFQAKKPINLHEIILDQTSSLVLGAIREKLNPDKFENLIKWYLEKCGATLVEIPAKNTGDKKGDADIVATFEALKVIIYVQAKHHLGTTGAFAVAQIDEYALSQEDANEEYACQSWVLTTADDFSEDCKRVGKEKNVRLISGKEFARRLLDVGFQTLDNI